VPERARTKARDAADWDARHAARAGRHDDPSGLLATEVGSLPPGRALDLACGTGRNALWLADRGWRVTAVDFSPFALAELRAAAGPGRAIEVVEADLRHYVPAAAAFDLVLIAYLHLPPADFARVLDAAAAAVAPGGTLLAVGHHVDNLEHGYGGPSNPALNWEPAAVATALATLAVERADRVARPVVDEHGRHVALDAFVRARSTMQP
jgi:SAM-dependent methyltransferase